MIIEATLDGIFLLTGSREWDEAFMHQSIISVVNLALAVGLGLGIHSFREKRVLSDTPK